MPAYVADRRLYLTADKSEIVEHGDPRSAFLLAGEGSEIGPDDVERLDISQKSGRIVYPGYEEESEPESKAAPAPENKMVEKAEDKGAEEDLSELTKAELVELAEERGIEVERAEGEGAPLKADYLRALGS